MINNYTIAYTVFNPTKPNQPPVHKKYTFEADLDLLGALSEGSNVIFDKYEGDGKEEEVLFRSITLNNAQEVYQTAIKEKVTDVRA